MDERINEINSDNNLNNYGEEKLTLNQVLGKTFLWMFLGLFLSAFIAWFTYEQGIMYEIVNGNYFNVLLIVELGVVIVFSKLLIKMPANVAAGLYFLYAALNGLTLGIIFALYELTSIINIFIAAAFIFGIFAFIGYKTKKDLSSFGIYIFIFLLMGIIFSLVNLFIFKSDMFSLIIDWFILLLFMGITIYDLNKFKRYYESGIIPLEKLHIYSAMDLYLDFINIFLRLLSIFGKRK